MCGGADSQTECSELGALAELQSTTVLVVGLRRFDGRA